MRRQLFLSFIVIALTRICIAQSGEAWIPSKVLGIVYPKLARYSQLEGDVKAKCSIKEDGSVTKVEILSSPHPLLSNEVKSNLLQWKFRHSGSGNPSNEIVVIYTFKFSGVCDDERFCKETEFWYEYPYHVIVLADQYSTRY
jgi:TonB family protein